MKKHILKVVVILAVCMALAIPTYIIVKDTLISSSIADTIEYKYVASVNSEVFHKPDCTYAKRIKQKNLRGYMTREEAINDGKRPCKVCNP